MISIRWHSRKYLIHFWLCIICLTCLHNAFAAIRIWTGSGADGLWNNPLNWDNGQLPQTADDILLDNSQVPINYAVTLPNAIVSIRTITIKPAPNQTIELLLPPTNLLENSFSVTGPGYGITLERGAIFLNSSGLA